MFSSLTPEHFPARAAFRHDHPAQRFGRQKPGQSGLCQQVARVLYQDLELFRTAVNTALRIDDGAFECTRYRAQDHGPFQHHFALPAPQQIRGFTQRLVGRLRIDLLQLELATAAWTVSCALSL